MPNCSGSSSANPPVEFHLWGAGTKVLAGRLQSSLYEKRPRLPHDRHSWFQLTRHRAWLTLHQDGGTSRKRYLRNGKNYTWQWGEEKSGRNGPTDTKAREGEEGALGIGTEIPLQPLEKTMVEQISTLQAHGEPHTRARKKVWERVTKSCGLTTTSFPIQQHSTAERGRGVRNESVKLCLGWSVELRWKWF